MQSKLAKDLRARRQGKYYEDSFKLKCIIMEVWELPVSLG